MTKQFRFGFCGANMAGRIENFTEAVKFVQIADSLGIDFCGFNDQLRDVYTIASICAMSTRHILVGPMASNPYNRHPATMARGVATIDEVSGGRAFLTLSRGGGLLGPKQLGYDTRHATERMREAITLIKQFLTGERVNFDGKFFQVHNVNIGFKCRANIPVYVAASGPKMIELAGELADGLVTPNSGREIFKITLDPLKRGLSRSGRNLANFEIILQPALQVTNTQEELNQAMNRSRSHVAGLILLTPAEWLEKTGISKTSIEALTEFTHKNPQLSQAHYYYDQDEEYIKLTRNLVTPEMYEALSIFGNAQEIAASLTSLQRLGATAVSIWTIPWKLDEKITAARTIAAKVVPHFR